MKALAELAALAAKVEGFVQPRVCCSLCQGTSLAWGTEPCFQCGCTGWTDDNSPAAPLMAVHMYVLTLEDDGGCSATINGEYAYGRFRNGSKLGTTDEIERTPEGIARAALVALLRAHGVEVPE